MYFMLYLVRAPLTNSNWNGALFGIKVLHMQLHTRNCNINTITPLPDWAVKGS